MSNLVLGISDCRASHLHSYVSSETPPPYSLCGIDEWTDTVDMSTMGQLGILTVLQISVSLARSLRALGGAYMELPWGSPRQCLGFIV